MMNWLRANGEALQGIGSILTAFLALLALVGVKIQVDAQAKVASAQAAREIYREFLTLSVAHPDLADPGDCPAFSDKGAVEYAFYFEHMLYTAEEVIAADATWSESFDHIFENHGANLCETKDWAGYTPAVQALIARVSLDICPRREACPDDE